MSDIANTKSCVVAASTVGLIYCHELLQHRERPHRSIRHSSPQLNSRLRPACRTNDKERQTREIWPWYLNPHPATSAAPPAPSTSPYPSGVFRRLELSTLRIVDRLNSPPLPPYSSRAKVQGRLKLPKWWALGTRSACPASKYLRLVPHSQEVITFLAVGRACRPRKLGKPSPSVIMAASASSLPPASGSRL